MSKLYKLKEWLTLVEATEYLSQALDEEVTESDILRLALDRHLTLSVDFVNKAYVRKGKVIHYPRDQLLKDIKAETIKDDLKWYIPSAEEWAALHPDHPKKASKTTRFVITSLTINDEKYITLNDDVVVIDGIWDLPMIGNERLDIEHRYQLLTDGPEVTLQGIDGAFVSRGDEIMCQLQEDFEDNQYKNGSKASGEALEQRIAMENIEELEAEKLRSEHKAQRKKYQDERKNWPRKNNYYPAGGLPEDAVLVVRMEALRKVQKVINKPSKKEVSTRERDTLYKIIIGMAIRGYAYKPKAQRNNAIADIVRDLEHLGIPVSDDTVRKYIKEAAELLDGNNE